MRIAAVTEADLDDLLVLLRGYCAFYRAMPSDEGLLELCRELLADPAREGVQLLARDDDGRAVGFATIFWSWSTLRAARLAVMNDLFVEEGARGSGAADALIAVCAEKAREHGATWLGWQTAPDNLRAQRVYERVGAKRSEWIDYGLAP